MQWSRWCRLGGGHTWISPSHNKAYFASKPSPTLLKDESWIFKKSYLNFLTIKIESWIFKKSYLNFLAIKNESWIFREMTWIFLAIVNQWIIFIIINEISICRCNIQNLNMIKIQAIIVMNSQYFENAIFN